MASLFIFCQCLQLLTIIAEAELLEILGYELPELLRVVSMQKYRIHKNLRSVRMLVADYTSLLEKLDAPLVSSFIETFNPQVATS